MPGVYKGGDFDLAGFIVGAVARDKILDGTRVRPGQVLLGVTSSGLHTNGYSLARKILFERLGLDVEDRPKELEGRSVGEVLLAVHRPYYRLLWPLLERNELAAMAHITGGGLRDNLPRVLNGHDAQIDLGAWEPPAIFRLLCTAGGIARDEANQAFNMGIGMVLFVEPDHEGAVRAHLTAQGERVIALGEVVPASGSRSASEKGVVRWK